jgi:hypothetical protein
LLMLSQLFRMLCFSSYIFFLLLVFFRFIPFIPFILLYPSFFLNDPHATTFYHVEIPKIKLFIMLYYSKCYKRIHKQNKKKQNKT